MSFFALEQHLLHEAPASKQFVELVEIVPAHIDFVFVLSLFAKRHKHGVVVWNEIDPDTNVGVSVTFAQYKTPDVRQLVQTSSRTSSDFTVDFPGSLSQKAFVLHEAVDLVATVASQIKPFHLFAVLVEEDQIWIVVRDIVHLQAMIRVSVARILYESACFRELVQASSRAALDFRRPCPALRQRIRPAIRGRVCFHKPRF